MKERKIEEKKWGKETTGMENKKTEKKKISQPKAGSFANLRLISSTSLSILSFLPLNLFTSGPNILISAGISVCDNSTNLVSATRHNSAV